MLDKRTHEPAEIAAVFLQQADNCQRLGSPFTAKLCQLIAERTNWNSSIGLHLLNWPGDASPMADVVPLRLCGALNHLAITGASKTLAEHYPPNKDPDSFEDDALWRVIESAMERHFEEIAAFMINAPQTNEVRRSIALIPCYHLIAEKFGLPLDIRELGASAGLNLCAGQFGLQGGGHFYGDRQSPVVLQPQWSGEGPRPSKELTIRSALGCDLAPIDCREEAQRLRLLSYIWPDQAERVQLTQRAIELQSSLAGSPAGSPVEKIDAIEWLEQQMLNRAKGSVLLVQHSIAWQYFPGDTQKKGEQLFVEHGKQADDSAPIARISMETDGRKDSALLQLTFWPDGEKQSLARVDFHGRWIEWLS